MSITNTAVDPLGGAGDTPATGSSPEIASAERPEAERVHLLLQSAAVGFILEAATSVALATALWRHVDTDLASVWLILVWGCSALRALLWQRYRRAQAAFLDYRDWSRIYIAVMGAAGALWSTGILFLWPADMAVQQLILALTICGVVAVVVVGLASHLAAATIYLASALAVIPFGLMEHAAVSAVVVLGATLVYAIALLVLARYVNGLILDGLLLRQQLAAAGEAAEAASRSKSQFIANMSHELRTPLNAILGFSEIIKSEAFGPLQDERYAGYARDIHSSGTHLLDVINDILDLSKIEAGKMELVDEVVDVGEVVSTAINLVKDSAAKGGVSLNVSIPDPTPSMTGDERAVKQILINLLSNAIKFTPLGGEVTIEAKRTAGGGLDIVVRDTGIGMAPEDVPRAMQPFGQVDGTLARKYEGTGLGLPLVKSMVEHHQGEFKLHSELGVGTTATASFPPECVRAPRGAASC